MKNAIGVIYPLDALLEGGPEPLLDAGMECVQVSCWNPALLTEDNANKTLALARDRLKISSFWAGWSGPAVWNALDGPHTLGLVPPAYRYARMRELCAGAAFARRLGVSNIVTHVGFIPDLTNPEYRGVVRAIAYVAEYCASLGLRFNFETGQETPVTLMRVIADIGLGNLGVNLDPANLILYGAGNPMDALEIFKGYIDGVHIKDAVYCTDTVKDLHLSQRLTGEGLINFPEFLAKLLAQGYTGDFYIEESLADAVNTNKYIRGILEGIEGRRHA
ncbi:MAG: sugar phosphate isomerase/epimerase [Clostridiales bacterium]|jgi:sugar phosphate isomerase/epimerase|nr:sugar phosphate isomerase/epimerase [Clostridiales bacterium]